MKGWINITTPWCTSTRFGDKRNGLDAGLCQSKQEMTRFLLMKFVNRYLSMKYMWEDAVFVHLYQKYFSQKEYAWLTAQGKKDHHRQGL